MVTLFKQFIIFFIFLILFSGNLKSNDFDDLIELYDQQILGEDALYNSLKKINEEFNSDQFDKLFNLFTNGVISKDDLLTALISKIPNTESVMMEKSPSDTSVKEFNITSCKGNSDVCSLMNKFFVEYEMNGSVMKLINHNFLDEPDVVSVVPRKQYYNNDGSFSEIIDIKVKSGRVLKMSIKGLIKDNDFLINFYSLKTGGKEVSSGNFD